MKIDIKRVFIDALVNYVNVSGVKDPRTIWVTEVSGCLLRSFLLRFYPKPIEDVRTAFKMIAGEAVHRVIQRYLDGSAEVEKIVVLPIDDFEVRGRIDIVLDGVAIEIKTCIDHPAPSDPLPPHVRQLQYYLNIGGIERGLIVYIDIKKGKVIDFEVERNEKFMNELITRSRFLKMCISRMKPPKPEKAPYNCASCPFQMDCLSGRYVSVIDKLRKRMIEREAVYMA